MLNSNVTSDYKNYVDTRLYGAKGFAGIGVPETEFLKNVCEYIKSLNMRAGETFIRGITRAGISVYITFIYCIDTGLRSFLMIPEAKDTKRIYYGSAHQNTYYVAYLDGISITFSS